MQIPTPITRKEMFLQKIAENGGGSGGSGGGSGGENWIGDGNTHIWISLPDFITSPILGVCPNGTVTVDWGDGTAPDTLTGTSTSTVKWTPRHNYASSGDYIVTLTVDGKMRIAGQQGKNGWILLNDASGGSQGDTPYRLAVRKVEVGNDTDIGDYAFAECHSLTSVKIPGSVTSIAGNAFSSCAWVRVYDFTNNTAVPTLSSTSAFSYIPTDCEIRVPAALYDEWIAATNWSTYASNIVAV